MSSLTYGNGVNPNNDDGSIVSSGAIIQNPYLSANPNAAYTVAAVAAVSSASPSSLGQYQHYYGHQVPQHQLGHVPPTASFYPPATLNPHQQHGDFSNNSSSSIASSSSSIESIRKQTNPKRKAAAAAAAATDKTTTAKSGIKRKLTNHNQDDGDDDGDDDDDENICDIRATNFSNVIMSNNNSNNPNNGATSEEDKEKQARENHCEIERRRRVKMATYFAELCDMVPSCSNLARKPDKLTILRMAAQYMKNLRTTNNSFLLNSSQQDLHKPSFLNDQELKYLMVESCDAFLFALNCDNFRVIYVSDAIQNILSYTCQDWYSRHVYDFIHPDDIEKVREQLNLQLQDGSPNANPNNRVLDLKTGTVKKDGHSSGARLASSKRSFICRIRVGSTNPIDHTLQNPFVNPCILRRRHRTSLGPSIDGHLYEVVHISGYIRNLTSHPHSSSHNENSNHHPSPSTSTSNGQMAFVAIARIQNSCLPNVNDLTNGSISTLNSVTTEFTCRCHWETGEILFIDQRCAPIIGYKSQDLLTKIIYDQIHPDDQMRFQDLYKRTVTQKNLSNTSANLANTIVRFRTNVDDEYVSLKTSTYAFCNPSTDDIEFIIVTLISMQPATNKTSVIANANDYNQQTYDAYARQPNQNSIIQNSVACYGSQSPSTFNSQDAQHYSTGNANNDARTYASNNGGSAWSSANDNWSANTSTTTVSTGNTDYTDTQPNIAIYHQYH